MILDLDYGQIRSGEQAKQISVAADNLAFEFIGPGTTIRVTEGFEFYFGRIGKGDPDKVLADHANIAAHIVIGLQQAGVQDVGNVDYAHCLLRDCLKSQHKWQQGLDGLSLSFLKVITGAAIEEHGNKTDQWRSVSLLNFREIIGAGLIELARQRDLRRN